MTDFQKTLALALLAATQFVLVLDASIVNVALPSMGRDLNVSPDDLSWVVNGYILMFGGFLLLGGRLADYFGRRRMYILGLGVFASASLAGTLAQSALWLVIARGAQGLGAALVSPAALALLMTLFREGAERNRALGLWAALGGSGGAAGAILGGALTDGLGWQAVLLVNLPIGALAMALAPRLIPESRLELGRRSFDVAGALTVTAGLTMLVYSIVDANAAGWGSAQTIGLGTLALLVLAGFVAIERRSRQPLVPLRIFRNRALRGGNLVTILNTGALFPMFFFVTLYTQNALGYSPIESGLAQLPVAVTIAVSATLAPRLVARTGYRVALTGGLMLVAAGLLWLAQMQADGSYVTNLLLPSLVVGIGEGAVWVSSMVAATSGADESESGLASGIVNTSQQLGGALGVAALVAVATARTADLTAAGGAPSPTALTEGFSAGLTVGAAIAAVAAIAAAVLLRSPRACGGRAPRRSPHTRRAADRRAPRRSLHTRRAADRRAQLRH
jgi:EmrB/QacA subfamily drug resistance transporter